MTTSRAGLTVQRRPPLDDVKLPRYNVDNKIIGKVIVDLLTENLIPNDAFFDIKEEHLSAYVRLYNLYRAGTQGIGTKTTSNYRYARKLAGLTLIKLKLEKGAKANQCKEGFVYTVSNPAWSNHVKIGMSVDVKKRLANYQTYSPFRDYKLANYEFVFNRREAESLIKDRFNVSLEAGEWYKDAEASEIMSFVRDHSLGA